MNKRKIIYFTTSMAILIASLIGIAYTGTVGTHTPPVGINVTDMSSTAEIFCTALNDGDYELIEELINGYSSLHLNDTPDEHSSQRLLDCLRDSYHCQLNGIGSTDGMTAQQNIRVSYFSLSLAEDDIKQHTQQLYADLTNKTHSNDKTYDEKGNLLESVALNLYEQAIDKIILEADHYTVTETITMELVFENGRWEIVLNDDLLHLLLGGRY